MGFVLPFPQLSPTERQEGPNGGSRTQLSSLPLPISIRRRPTQAAESFAPPEPISPEREAALEPPPGEPRALVPSWEQKPVAVLAIEFDLAGSRGR